MSRSLLSAIVVVSLAGTACAQVESIEYFKSGVFRQNSNTPPTQAQFWTFVGRVITDYAGDLTGVDLSAEGLGLSASLTQNGIVWLWYSPPEIGRAELDADYPDGVAYTFDLFGPSAIGTAAVQSSDSLFVEQIPHFSGTMYDQLQELNPYAPFAIEVGGFDPVAGAIFPRSFSTSTTKTTTCTHSR